MTELPQAMQDFLKEQYGCGGCFINTFPDGSDDDDDDDDDDVADVES